MKQYDYLRARKFIDKHKSEIAEATLGMNEDWSWTADSVFSNGKYLYDLRDPNLKIAGISSSGWATPILSIDWIDGDNTAYSCWIGESDGVDWMGVSHGEEYDELLEMEA